MKRRFWLFLLLAPVAFFMVKLNFDSPQLVALYGGTAAIGFGAGGLALFWTGDGKNTWLRFAPLALLAVPLYWAWQAWNSQSFLAAFAVLIYIFVALCGLCGWGAAWGLTGFKSFGPEEPAPAAEAAAPVAESVSGTGEPAETPITDETPGTDEAPTTDETPATDKTPGE